MTYTFKIKGDTTEALRGMQKLRSAVSGISGKINQVDKDTQKSTRSMGNGFDSLARSVRGLVGAYLGLNAAQQIFQTGMQRERMTNFIKMMAGSASETKRITNDIITMSAGMGVNVNSMGETFGMMSQVMDKANALEMTKRVGLVASFSGFDPRVIGLNLMQMASAGKAFADMMDIRQTMEKYPLFLKYIAKVKGVTPTEANLGLKQGRYLTGEEAVKAFAMMTDQGSELSKFLDEYTKSFLFKWGQMKVQLQNMAVAIYEALRPALEMIATLLIKIGNTIQKISEWFKGSSTSADLFRDAIKLLVTILMVAVPLLIAFKVVLGAIAIINFATQITEGATAMKLLATSTGSVVMMLTAAVIALATLHDNLRDLASGQGAFQIKMVNGMPIIAPSDKQLAAENVGNIKRTIDDWKRQGMKETDPRMIEKEKELRSAIGTFGAFTEPTGFRFYKLVDDLFKNVKLGDLKLGKVDFAGLDAKGATTDAAMDTGNLYGAHGGLGDSKIIHLHFNKALVENNIAHADSNTMMKSGETAAQYILRIVNNLGYRQSYAY